MVSPEAHLKPSSQSPSPDDKYFLAVPVVVRHILPIGPPSRRHSLGRQNI